MDSGDRRRLLTKACAGDIEAYKEFFSMTCAKACIVARCMSQGPGFEAEVLTKSYTSSFDGLPGLNKADGFEKLIFRTVVEEIGRNIAEKHTAAPTGGEAVHTDYVTLAEVSGDCSGTDLAKPGLFDTAFHIVTSLPEDLRLCFLAYYFLQIEPEETGRVLGLASDAVKTKLYYSVNFINSEAAKLRKIGYELAETNNGVLPMIIRLLDNAAQNDNTSSPDLFRVIMDTILPNAAETAETPRHTRLTANEPEKRTPPHRRRILYVLSVLLLLVGTAAAVVFLPDIITGRNKTPQTQKPDIAAETESDIITASLGAPNIIAYYELNETWTGPDGFIRGFKVILPAFESDSPGAMAINTKIGDVKEEIESEYKSIDNLHDYNARIECSYETSVYETIIGIIITKKRVNRQGETESLYYCFSYDYLAGKELAANDMAEKFNANAQQVLEDVNDVLKAEGFEPAGAQDIGLFIDQNGCLTAAVNAKNGAGKTVTKRFALSEGNKYKTPETTIVTRTSENTATKPIQTAGTTKPATKTTAPTTKTTVRVTQTTSQKRNYTVLTNGSNLNLRVGPGLEHKVVAEIPNKSTLVVDEISDGWAHTVFNGISGWVTMEYLKPVA